MNILFFGTKTYDRDFFERLKEREEYRKLQITFIEPNLSYETAKLADGYDAVCAFVNMDISRQVLKVLADGGVKLVLMRCAGYNNVDLEAAREYGITVTHVPSYSPEAVAEHAMALVLTANRHMHKAYIKCRENNFNLAGLMGINLNGKTAGIIGTGKIGAAMARICQGFGMQVIGYDKYPNPSLSFIKYVELEELFKEADLISLHCPLTEENYHMIDQDAIEKMKDGVILVNTSRGALIKTEDLIQGIRDGKFFAVGLDVYEEETGMVYEDMSDRILEHSTMARLLSFPNVCVTSHQGFFTSEALLAISETTMENALAFSEGRKNGNEL